MRFNKDRAARRPHVDSNPSSCELESLAGLGILNTSTHAKYYPRSNCTLNYNYYNI